MLLSDLTTLRLGGPAGTFVEATTDDALIAAVRDAPDDDLLLVAGGSNLVVGDAGFPGTVVKIASRGIQREGDTLHVAAGEGWDDVVRHAIAHGLGGIECLSGIPGSVGATPIQNVGAYGQEVSDTIVNVRVYDRRGDRVVDLTPAQCGFAYRDSMFKRSPGSFVVLRVSFALTPSETALPIRYGELARATPDAPTLQQVRDAVLALRRGKGMVLDPRDHDTWSAGSFFTNPILDADAVPDGAPAFPQPDGRVKTSAAWLIDHAGFAKGHRPPGSNIAISTKHVLALTNRGGGTTAELLTLADEVTEGVLRTYGIRLVPEPVLVRT
ncbi:UDP-N-acetylenolpyruvoylglucosamine reductase [Baekduia alba]|nr:UDP-N-acetylmuramate dehydrogenase [Baekduia alba]WCB91914.1 UDP-N-acetylenolpyruvoylglucosamine reductase [Baekduia alba]